MEGSETREKIKENPCVDFSFCCITFNPINFSLGQIYLMKFSVENESLSWNN